MGVTLYPAKLENDEWVNVVPMQGDSERVKEDARFDYTEDPFEPNPEYIPFSSIDISEGNCIHLMKAIGALPADGPVDNKVQVKVLFDQAHDWLWNVGGVVLGEQYEIERVFQFREMARLGIARGATHVVWS